MIFKKIDSKETIKFIKKIKTDLVSRIGDLNVNVACLSKIHFNFHHLVSVTIIGLLAFFVTFFSTGFNTRSVNASGLDAPVIKEYNNEMINVNYGDTKAIANLAKDILKEEVSSVVELKTINTSLNGGVYELSDYVVSVEIKDLDSLGDKIATLSIETKATHDKNVNEKLSMNVSTDDADFVDGTNYTYQIKVNVIDTTAPIISLSESEVKIMDTDTVDIKNYIASVSDNVDGLISDYTIEGEALRENDKYVEGEHIFTIRTKDKSGNEASQQFKLIVEKTKEATVSEDDAYVIHGESAYAGSLVAEARTHIGKAYVYGASGPNAFDCSGFVSYVFSRSGISIPRTSGGQAGAGVEINPNDVSQWSAGDIVTFGPGGNDHAAIYSGAGTLIHALNPTQGVKETGLYGFGTIYSVRRIQ